MIDGEDAEFALLAIQQIMESFSAKPHLGKFFFFYDTSYFTRLYGDAVDNLVEMVGRYDSSVQMVLNEETNEPEILEMPNKFASCFTERYLFNRVPC